MSMIRDQIIKAINEVVDFADVHLETPEIESHGDYSTNVAMLLFATRLGSKKKILRKFRSPRFAKSKRDDKAGLKSLPTLSNTKSPRELAEAIVKGLKRDKQLSKIVDKIEVAGPGFINFHLARTFLARGVDKILKDADRYGSSDVGKGKTVIVEYSSPNIARHFSIGHLRSTIIGQALYNTFKFSGYKTVGENHLGDWGTQFGMIIAAVIKNNLEGKKLPVNKYQELYVSYNLLAAKDSSVKDNAKNWFKKLEDGERRARRVWKNAVGVSLTEFDRIYNVLGVKIDNAHGESFYEDKMPAIIDEFRKKGLAKKSEGAEIVELKGMVPGILLKSDGGTTYFTRDLAALKYRLDTWGPQVLIYEVGVEQQLHFRQVFESARLVGWVKNEKLVHVPHGHYRFKGKKISTRRGTEVILEDIIDEAIKRARKILDTTQTAKDLSPNEKNEISKAVGIGAIKYFDLSHRPTSQIDFDWEGMFNMQGNSGPYLQYTVARTNSVLAKLKTNNKKLITKKDLESLVLGLKLNTEELALMRAFPQFPEVISDVVKSYSPNLLCNYLFDLAQKYNGFYNSCRILNPKVKGQEGEKVKDFRITLTAATGQILKNGLTLLGIQAPERM